MEININIQNNAVTEATYEEKLQEARKKIYGNEIARQLQLAQIGNERYQQICDKITKITNKPVWEDYNFKTGKILGILRSIAQNPKQRKELLEATGLNEAVIDLYFKYCGNLPYLDNQNLINPGRPMDVEATKEFLPIVGSMLGLLVDEGDLLDITEQRWEKLYENAMTKAMETSEFNKVNKGEVEYDE